MSERRIVQIACSSDWSAEYVYAVADDGTAWHTTLHTKAWVQLPALPASQDAKGGA